MTRQEKNIAKQKYRRSVIIGYICLGLLVICFIGLIFIPYKPNTIGYILAIMCIFFLMSCLACTMAAGYFIQIIGTYRRDLRCKRNRILLKIGVEAIQNENWSKSEMVYRIMSYDHRVFLKGYLLASYRASDDDKLILKAQNILENLYENL